MAYGARPLKRVIQRSLQNPLAQLIVAGRLGDGETVRISAGADGLIIDGHDGEALASAASLTTYDFARLPAPPAGACAGAPQKRRAAVAACRLSDG